VPDAVICRPRVRPTRSSRKRLATSGRRTCRRPNAISINATNANAANQTVLRNRGVAGVSLLCIAPPVVVG
jgi:hypothetical protein